jgi:hypothetical protein
MRYVRSIPRLLCDRHCLMSVSQRYRDCRCQLTKEELVVDNAISVDNPGENTDQVSILTNEIGSIARALNDIHGTG